MESSIQKIVPNTIHLLPNQPSNPDFSGKWSESEDSAFFIPKDQPREYQRKEILLAATQGRLGLRRIDLNNERTYLDQKYKEPRPVCFIQYGIPIKLISGRNNVLGILNPKVLAVYKANATTSNLVNSGKAVDDLETKCLADTHQIQNKVMEEAERQWNVYANFTSGHLQPDGTFTLPKLKQYRKGCYPEILPYPEFLTTGYDKSQIKCYCITKTDANRNITDILEEKHTLENTLGIGPLPLAVYCEHSGSMEVYFDEELEGNQLKHNENCLNDIAKLHNMDWGVFREILNMLPMTLKSEIINKSELTPRPPLTPTLIELIAMVLNPACYNPERLQAIKDSGFSFNEHFCFEDQCTSLFELFFEKQRRQFFIDNYLSRKSDTSVDKSSNTKSELLFYDLISSGATNIRKKFVYRNFAGTPPHLCNYLEAVLPPSSFIEFWEFMIHPVDFPAIKLEIDRTCRNSHDKLAELLNFALQRPFSLKKNYTFFRRHLLALFYYGAAPGKELLDAVRQGIINSLDEIINRSDEIQRTVLGNSSIDDYLEWVWELYRHREQDPFYQSWPAQVEEAKVAIAQLKATLDLQASLIPSPSQEAYDRLELGFVVDAFSKPPVLANARDNEESILRILQHYYRRPGPERVLRSLHRESLPTVWKPVHACSHVLRARNNVLWYLELLEKFQIMNCTEDEKTLLALAAIYHDAAAEDVDKDHEEKRSAEYFKRDLIGQYPQPLVDDVALALESKENKNDDSMPATVRGYLRVLRFADRMDIIRCTGVEKNFPGLATPNPGLSTFNGSLLDFPPELSEFTADPKNKSLFQRHLEAAMHGAADLAQVTGHLLCDHRPDPYVQSCQLTTEGKNLTEQFERTTRPVGKMDDFVNDNVRRKIARLAGILTCTDPNHKTCGTDTRQGITRGIHNSWYDLQQIRIPDCMTRLEKMQCEYDMGLLSKETQQAIATEVQRLKSRGILMNLGTLTQDTLRSEPAKMKLKQRGLSVVIEKHLRGYDEMRKPRFEEVLVPKAAAPENLLLG